MEAKIKSVSGFIEAIKKSRPKDIAEEEPQALWFRGEGSINWKTPLVPNIYRTLAETFQSNIDDLFTSINIKQVETNIHAEFKRKAQRHISTKGIENSRWNRYFLMQHYKIKTRLLDWTENAMLALFFAISNESSFEEDSIVWILNPFKLNDLTIRTIINSKKSYMIIPPGVDSDGPHELIMEDGKIRISELTRRYVRMDFLKDSEDNQIIYYPLAIYPTYLDERMTAQKTCFTIFGNKINGLLSNDLNLDFLSSVIIEGGLAKSRMLDELKMLGIDYASVLPDLDGIGLSINSKYEKNFRDNLETINHVFESNNGKLSSKKTDET
jgi:hypothetical protein